MIIEKVAHLIEKDINGNNDMSAVVWIRYLHHGTLEMPIELDFLEKTQEEQLVIAYQYLHDTCDRDIIEGFSEHIVTGIPDDIELSIFDNDPPVSIFALEYYSDDEKEYNMIDDIMLFESREYINYWDYDAPGLAAFLHSMKNT